jgi:hypothetical protein
MKTLGSFINKKNLVRGPIVDQQSVFYIFQIVIKEEYGRQGVENIVPVLFRDRKIFIKSSGSALVSDILLKRSQIIGKINKELGGEEIVDLVLTS